MLVCCSRLTFQYTPLESTLPEDRICLRTKRNTIHSLSTTETPRWANRTAPHAIHVFTKHARCRTNTATASDAQSVCICRDRIREPVHSRAPAHIGMRSEWETEVSGGWKGGLPISIHRLSLAHPRRTSHNLRFAYVLRTFHRDGSVCDGTRGRLDDSVSCTGTYGCCDTTTTHPHPCLRVTHAVQLLLYALAFDVRANNDTRIMC